MMENYELVEKGFNILHPALAKYVFRSIYRKYRNGWWQEIRYHLGDPKDLPLTGSDEELMGSLDMANCLRIADWFWSDIFRYEQKPSFRAWAKELMGIRNTVAHRGIRDLEVADTERALDTMARMAAAFDEGCSAEIRTLYNSVRFSAEPAAAPSVPAGAVQPLHRSGKSGNLLQLVGTDAVQRTTISKKLTFGGKTEVYPVYRVRLDQLYYNDQNDRIATWLSRYDAEHGQNALDSLTPEEYNNVIESFIYESNPESIKKTQNSILNVTQEEPGVTLADGRVVDGNRRFTCLRRIQRDSGAPAYFDTVLMDADIQEDRKLIKMLELSIQHGKEKQVDYDLIDYAVGAYREIVLNKTFTVEEYAAYTAETPNDVRKRIACAEMISEFLNYIGLPGQYHAAREYKVYSVFFEMLGVLKRLQPEEQKQLRQIVANNVIMHALVDQRKFIRDIDGLVKHNTYGAYFAEQRGLNDQIHKKLEQAAPTSRKEMEQFAAENENLTEELQMSLQRALLRSRNLQMKSRPSEHVNKCIELMTEVDPRLFSRMSETDRQNLKMQMEELANIAAGYAAMLG